VGILNDAVMQMNRTVKCEYIKVSTSVTQESRDEKHHFILHFFFYTANLARGSYATGLRTPSPGGIVFLIPIGVGPNIHRRGIVTRKRSPLNSMRMVAMSAS
jgi:hypothetical protein